MTKNDKSSWEAIYKERSLEEIPWHSEKPAEYLVELLQKKEVKVGFALDVCSGAGTNATYLAKKGFDVTGVDISQTATKHAEHRAKREGVSKKCRFFSGDLTKMNLSKERFDFIFDRGCYHHISEDDKPRFVRTINESLKKGGKYFSSCFTYKNPPSEKNVSKEEIMENFSQYFEIATIEDFATMEKTGRELHFYLALMAKR